MGDTIAERSVHDLMLNDARPWEHQHLTDREEMTMSTDEAKGRIKEAAAI